MRNVIRKIAGFALTAALAYGMVSCANNANSSANGTTKIMNDTDFVKVEGGTVTGDTYSPGDIGIFSKSRTVTLSSFYICKYEITQAQYKAVMTEQKAPVIKTLTTEYPLEASPSYCTGTTNLYGLSYGKDHSNYPVENITWYDAIWFCNALSAKEGLDACYTINVKTVEDKHITYAVVTYDKTKNGYRLPTDAEWEYAARGGDPSKTDWNYLFSGADSASGVNYTAYVNSGLDSVGWYNYNGKDGKTSSQPINLADEETHEVGKKNANRLGLYDMSGNVEEWCWDTKGSIKYGETVTDPTCDDSSDRRIVRGGAWYSAACDCSVFVRCGGLPGSHTNKCGFRICRKAN